MRINQFKGYPLMGLIGALRTLDRKECSTTWNKTKFDETI